MGLVNHLLYHWLLIDVSPEKKNNAMNVEETIRMFDNPATLNEALSEAAKLSFRGDDKVRFEQKRQRYILMA